MSKSNVDNNVEQPEKETKVDVNRPLKGIMFTNMLMCVQHGKKFLSEDEKGDYYYNLTFSDGQEIFSCTCGNRVGDDFKLLHNYRLGLIYQDKKLKIVDFVEIPVSSTN